MKKLIVFLLLVIIPNFCLAGWVGTKDPRRYVSDEEKTVFPYNKIVKIQVGNSLSTGTIVAPNIVLTCGHCICEAKINSSVKLYMSNGQTNTGSVWYSSNRDDISNDYALIVFRNEENGPFLNMSNVAVPDKNVMRIGYDTLKILQDDEIPVVKKAFADVLGKYKTITDGNVFDAMNDVESQLQKYSCKSESDKNCVRCSGNESCIFDDGDRLKVQDSCSATTIQPVSSGGSLIVTNCAGNQGGSGSPLIDSAHKNIIGIMVGTFEFGVGGEVKNHAIRPEVFYEKAKTLVNMSNNGLIEF